MKHIIAIITGLFLLIVFSTKSFAQQKTITEKDSLKDELYAVIDDSLQNYIFFCF